MDLSQSHFLFPQKTNKHVIKKSRHYLGRSQSSGYQSFHTVVHLFSPALCFEFSSVKPKQNLALPLRVMFIISHECVSGLHNAISNTGLFTCLLSVARTHHMLILSLKLALPLFQLFDENYLWWGCKTIAPFLDLIFRKCILSLSSMCVLMKEQRVRVMFG